MPQHGGQRDHCDAGRQGGQRCEEGQEGRRCPASRCRPEGCQEAARSNLDPRSPAPAWEGFIEQPLGRKIEAQVKSIRLLTEKNVDRKF